MLEILELLPKATVFHTSSRTQAKVMEWSTIRLYFSCTPSEYNRDIGSAESKHPRLTNREIIIFEEFLHA